MYGSHKGLCLLQALAAGGLFIFTSAEAKAHGAALGISDNYVSQALRRLEKGGWITALRRGLYAGTGSLPGGIRVHAFAVATRLVSPSAISHWSAMSHHGLTDQIPLLVTAMTPKKVVTPTMRRSAGKSRMRHTWEAAGISCQYVSVIPDHFFGVEEVWVDERFRVPITDRERTILDTLISPNFFGGICEGLSALEAHIHEVALEKLVEYAVRYGKASVAKRLGWALERLGAPTTLLERLERFPIKGFRLLDPTRPRRGPYDTRWMIQDNLKGGRPNDEAS